LLPFCWGGKGRTRYENNKKTLGIALLLEVRCYEFEYFDVLQSLNLGFFEAKFSVIFYVNDIELR
jgi:hypothetical protein